jgi:intracellular multiplication protein IcmO
LKDQTEGEAHIFFKSQIVRVNMFYAAPKPVKKLKINQFLKVEPPPSEYLDKLKKQLLGFQTIIASDKPSIDLAVESETIGLVAQALQDSAIAEPVERSVAVLLSFHRHNEPEQVDDVIEDEVTGVLTIFAPLRQPSNAPPILVKDKITFAKALLPIQETRDNLISIERLTGQKANMAGKVANEIIKDFQSVTNYPPDERHMGDGSALAEQVNLVALKITRARKAAAEAKND